MKGVLVTSATTPLGRALVQTLLADPSVERVLALGCDDRAWAFPHIASSALIYRQVDLTRSRELHDLLFGLARDLEIEVVVHSALHRNARDEGRATRELNVAVTRQLLRFADGHPCIRHLVFRSTGSVYRIDPKRAVLLTEEHPLELSPAAPQSVRDRVEADLTVCTRMGMLSCSVALLRCAEILAANVGSQLFDYLQSRLCFRPIGFDPMLNVLSLEDATRALTLAVRSTATGVFNIPGADTLPLSRAIELWGRVGIPLPGPLLSPLYRARASAFSMEFRYDMNHRRFHFSAVLDGTRARAQLGFEPRSPIAWPLRLGRPSSVEPELATL